MHVFSKIPNLAMFRERSRLFRAVVRHEFATGDIETMLTEIEMGYLASQQSLP